MKPAAVWVFAGALFLAGCSNDGGNDAPARTTTSPTQTAVTTTSAPPPTLSGTVEASPSEIPDEVPIVDELPTEQASDEPYVVECLEGTPGPALFSDGTKAFSQWCFDQLGGDEYLRQEREANTFECNGQVCRNPYTGVTYPDPDAQSQLSVGTTSDRGYSCYETGCYWPNGSPVTNADRCGTRCGEPLTSAEIQTQHGCEAGYITDPELCAADAY